MARYLVIVESPTKVKTIKKFLGSNYVVMASNGHVRDLPKSQMGVDLEHDFEPKYITIRGKGEILANLRKEVKKADKVYLATDPDREGEAISWHLSKALKLEGKDVNRISFNEITQSAVKASLKQPRDIDMNLVNAQQARRILDRMVGYKISPLLWAKVKRGLSAGRVQSVALRIICDREEEINGFIPEEYWTLDADFTIPGERKPLTARFYGTEKEKNATVNLTVDNALAGEGTIAAANGGTVNLSLGAYSNWAGRADDYQDAAADSQWGDLHAGKIDNAFGDDKEISSSGTVNLSLGEGAMWDVTGQSWVTELNGNNSLVILDGDGTGGHALHVGKLTGTNTFTMNVRPDETGDMLYVKDGSQAGTQNLIINNRDEVLEAMDVGDKIRFATVQNAGGGFADADIDDTSSLPSGEFGKSTRIADAGVFNVDFNIEYHKYGDNV